MFVLASPSAYAQQQDLADTKHNTLLAEVSKKPCVPPPAVLVSKREELSNHYRIALGVEAGSLIACAARVPFTGIGAAQAPFACWSVAPKTGALTTYKPTLLPGASQWTPSACALGYCRPNQ
jgi:hypothetical protein